MGRKFLIILLIGLAFWGLRKVWNSLSARTTRTTEPRFEKTVRCAHCGTHVSVQLAVECDGKHYCCREHLPEQR